MKKKIIICLLSLTMLIVSFLPIMAEENCSLEDFNKTIENTEYYEEYKNSIIERDVFVEADTDEGKRFTTRYVLSCEDNEKKYLIFIGDIDGNIIEVLLILNTDELISMSSLLDKKTTNIHTRGPVYECVTIRCDKWKTDYNFDPQPGCSTIVGQPCNDLAIIIGKPWAKLVCKLGVFIACSITSEKVCTHYYEDWDICDL